jgi:hypothetical protein
MDPWVEETLGYLVVMVLVIVPAWRVFARAGLAPALSLLVFVPFVGLFIAGVVLALRRWPSLESER